MRRFSVYKRGKKFYVQFWNPDTKKYTPGKSTGAETRRDAQIVALTWIENGIPARNTTRNVSETLNVDTLFHLLRKADLTPDDAKRIVQVLTERQLVSLQERPQKDSFKLTEFLTQFWDYDRSPYVQEKLAYGHRVGKRHCYDMTMHVKNHWLLCFRVKRRLGALRGRWC